MKFATVLSLVAAVAALRVHAVAAQALAAASAGPAGAAALAGVPTLPKTTACVNSVKVSPWDVGTRFPNVVVCCGGTVDFQWSGLSSVWQTASAACPASFVSSASVKKLLPATMGSGGVKSLYLPVPGSYYLTSGSPGACQQGLKFLVQVPPESGSVCPASTTTQVSNGPGSQAAAQGSPGGTSTSTGLGSAASASGPPGSSFTATGPGQSFSQSG